MIALLLAACHHAAPPVLYPMPTPPLVPPPQLTATRVGDECAAPAAFIPGQPPPYVDLDDDGRPVASCRGLVVDDAAHAELLADLDSGIYWRDLARVCYAGREGDRAYAQAAYDTSWSTAREVEAEARRLRALTPVAIGGGLLLGAGFTLAIVQAVELVQ